MQTTYSFLDSAMIVSHPLSPAGPIIITGEGAGTVAVAMIDVRTAMDVAADGAVMVSKMAGNTGTVTIAVQQTSLAHKKLLAMYNQLILAPPSVWAQAAMTIRNVTDGSGHLCTGITFQKVPDKSYQKEGQHITWTILCADIENVTV